MHPNNTEIAKTKMFSLTNFSLKHFFFSGKKAVANATSNLELDTGVCMHRKMKKEH
jgi:hypothetical protein